MKRTLVVLFAIGLTSAWCFAEMPSAKETTAPASKVAVTGMPMKQTTTMPATTAMLAAVKTSDAETVACKVENITPTEITTEDNNKHYTTYSVNSMTTIYGDKGLPMNLMGIKSGDMVKVKYKVVNGMKEATSIYLTK